MQAQLEEIVRQFQADTGSIHLLEDGILVLKAQLGLPPHVTELVRQIPVGRGMAGLAAEHNSPFSSCNIQADQTGNVRPGAKDTGVNGAIVVPIRNAEGAVQGTLGIGVHRDYEYTAEETAKLMAIAETLAPQG